MPQAKYRCEQHGLTFKAKQGYVAHMRSKGHVGTLDADQRYATILAELERRHEDLQVKLAELSAAIRTIRELAQ